VTLPIVISDTSPLRALQHLDLVVILRKLYDRVYIPDVVAVELNRAQRRFPGLDLSAFPFLVIETAQDQKRLAELQRKRLDAGEVQAILLALEKSAGLILIDERMGRRVATEMGLHAVGVLGVLLQAKQQALISAIGPHIIRLQKEIDFHLSPALIREVLRIAQE